MLRFASMDPRSKSYHMLTGGSPEERAAYSALRRQGVPAEEALAKVNAGSPASSLVTTTSTLYSKTTWLIREARRLRSYYKARRIPVGPPPTKEQVKALAVWAAQKEQTLATGVSGLGAGEAEGAVAGATTGATVGMVAGPWGAAVGALVGGVAGAFTGKAQAAKAAKSAAQAEKAAKLQLQAAKTTATGQVKVANLTLEAEKVKADAARKIPMWMWVSIGAAGIVVVTGSIVLATRKKA